MLRSALVHTSLSPEDDLIVPFASGLAALGLRRVVLASVVDASGLEGPVIVAKVDKVRERLRVLAAPLRDAGLEVEIRVPTGTVDSEILGLAAETHVDTIVSGTHGKSHVDRFIAGSISEQLLTEAERPSLFVRFSLLTSATDPSALSRDFGRRLLMVTDFSAPATRALMAVLGLPEGSVGRLCLLHAVDPSQGGDRQTAEREGAAFQLAALADMARDHGLDVETAVGVGEVASVVLAEMRDRGATGVVCGTRGRNALANALFGSLSLSLLQQATCPVLAVP